MSSCEEEQAMELEVLESLFPNEMRRSAENACDNFSLIGLVPYSDQSQENFVSIDIKFIFPPKYPLEQYLQYEIIKISGGNIANDSKKIELLNEVIDSEIESAGLGYPIVYQVVEKIVEFLRDNNREEQSLHDQLLLGGKEQKRIRDRKNVVVDNHHDHDDDDEDDEDDSDYVDDEDSYSDDSSYDESSDSSFEDEDEDYKGLQLKNLCAESDRVTNSQFEEWKLDYDKWLMLNGWIKRVAESDLRPTGKQQFLSVLMSRRTAAAGGGDDNSSTMKLVGESGIVDFDEELFGEEDVDLDDDEEEEEEIESV